MAMKLADNVFVFCPGSKKGIMFYDQSPSGAEAILMGSLRDWKFFSSGEKVVEWDETINGEKKSEINDVCVTNRVKVNVVGDSYTATTVLVPDYVFESLLEQIRKPNMYVCYKVLDFNNFKNKKNGNPKR